MKNTKLLNIVYFIIIFVLCCTFVWVEYIFINQIRDDINSIGCFLGIFHPTIFIGVTEVIALPFVCYYSNKTRIKSVILFMLATAVALMYNIYNEWIISRSILNIIVMTFVWGYPSLMITAFFGDIENNFKISHAITDENLVQAELLIDILEVLTFNEICIGVVMKNSNCSLFYLPISYYNEKFCKFAKSQNGVFECPYFDDRINNYLSPSQQQFISTSRYFYYNKDESESMVCLCFALSGALSSDIIFKKSFSTVTKKRI